jgi:uncharacterized protein
MILSWCCWSSEPGGDSRMTAVFTTHRAVQTPNQNHRLGVALNLALQRKVVLMEKNTQEELKAHLMATNEEFRSLAEKHATYHKQLEELEAKPHLSIEDEAQEHQLKKHKLRLKDQMNEIMARYRAQHVA